MSTVRPVNTICLPLLFLNLLVTSLTTTSSLNQINKWQSMLEKGLHLEMFCLQTYQQYLVECGSEFPVRLVTSQYFRGTEHTHLTHGTLSIQWWKDVHLEYFPKESSHTGNTHLPPWCSNCQLLIYVMDRRNECWCVHTLTNENILVKKNKHLRGVRHEIHLSGFVVIPYCWTLHTQNIKEYIFSYSS